MATDNPYGLDFLFSEITDVHFGSDWVMVYAQGTSGTGLAGATIDVSFPQEAGGTPGWNLMTLNKVTMTGLRNIPTVGAYTIVAADLTSKIRTGAGLGLTGFGLQELDVVDPTQSPIVAVLFEPGVFTPTFQVKFNRQGTGAGFHNSSLVGTSIFKSGLIKSGLRVGDIYANLTSIATSDQQAGGNNQSPIVTFSVDTKKLTVTLL